jgi:hypothetical protein
MRGDGDEGVIRLNGGSLQCKGMDDERHMYDLET